jgi:hypothetical protein
MRRASRYMPAFVPAPDSTLTLTAACGFLVALAAGYLWFLRRWPIPVVLLTLVIAAAVVVKTRQRRRQLRRTAAARSGESLCTFARALPVRDMDPWVVRAVFEQLQLHLQDGCPDFPLRPSDRLVEDLRIDPEDLEPDLVGQIAQRTGRPLTNAKGNPYFGKVFTVEDLVRFFTAQRTA